MKRTLALIATAVLASVYCVTTSAAMITWETGVGKRIRGNDLGIRYGYVGTDLLASRNLVLTFEFLGSEAAWDSFFQTTGGEFFNHATYDQGVLTVLVKRDEYLPFGFYVSENGQVVLNGSNFDNYKANKAGGYLPDFLVSVLGERTFYVGLNDDGGYFDNDYDDLGVKITVKQVPEPAAITLFALGLLGIGFAKRRLAA